ncbi:MAG TPA: multiheme c-type cytochrome [Candidatus Polarisedimenticolia bacterium]|nr:multiheme c-type cytochrome [Candidatus Polarisedimenticolia bacterium]
MQTDALVEGMNALGYMVANFSQRELIHGYDAFADRRKKARFEFVSTNIVWQDTGEPLVASSVVRKVDLRPGAKAGAIRVGFIGLTQNNPAFLKEGPAGRRIVTIDPFLAAEKVLPALAKKTDLVVALVSLGVDEARSLAKRVKGIDLVLGGGGGVGTRTDDFPEDTQFGRARIFFINNQGKDLGEVRLFFNGQRAIASAQRNIIGLSREWPEDPALTKLAEATKVAVNEYNRSQAAQVTPVAAPVAPGQGPSFTGSERCGVCHAQEFAIWQRTGHARAFATLEKAQQDYNPKCVSCHSVGYGQTSGFVNAKATPGLENVGCESCHGPSSPHPDQIATGYGGSNTSFCVTCHTRENSPDFNPATYIPKVRHWPDAQAGR